MVTVYLPEQSWLHRARNWREIPDVIANASGAAGHDATNVSSCRANCTSVCANQSSETKADIRVDAFVFPGLN